MVKLILKPKIRLRLFNPTFNNLAVFFVYIYILTIFVFTYDVKLNIISKVLFLLMTFFTALYILEKRTIRNGIIYVLLSSCGLFSLLSIFWSENQNYAFSKNITLIQLILLAFVIYNIIDTELKVIKAFNAIYLGGYIMILYALKDYGISGLIDGLVTGTRLGGDINQENAFGLYCGITFIIAIYHYMYHKNNIHIVLSILPLLFAISSGSRKSIFVLLIGFIILYYYKNRSNKFLKTMIIIIILFMSFQFVSSLPIFSNTFRRLHGLLNIFTDEGVVDNSTLVRKEMIEFGFKLFKERPLFGYGTEQYGIQYLKHFGIVRPSHNNYVQLLVSFGIIGFSLWYSMYYYIISNMYKIVVNNKVAVLILSIFMISLFNDLTMISFTDKLFFIFIALGFSYSSIIKNQISNQKTL